MITIHDLMGNGCCMNPYTDFAIVNIKTGEVLVDRVHDKTYTVDDNKDYDQFLAYEWKTVRAWEAKDGKMIFYILPPQKEGHGFNIAFVLHIYYTMNLYFYIMALFTQSNFLLCTE